MQIDYFLLLQHRYLKLHLRTLVHAIDLLSPVLRRFDSAHKLWGSLCRKRHCYCCCASAHICSAYVVVAVLAFIAVVVAAVGCEVHILEINYIENLCKMADTEY